MSQGFEDLVRSIGLRPRSAIQPDGKWHRCPTDSHPRKRNGAWKLDVSGRIGWVQDWASMTEPATWYADEDTELPEYDPEQAARAATEARRAQAAAREAAREYYATSRRLSGPHPYLAGKALSATGCADLRVDPQGWLVVPAYRHREIVSLQRISSSGKKLFWAGAGISGTTHLIRRRRATVNVLVEGLATGLACYQAIPTCQVWVMWSAGNLGRPDQMPGGLTVIAADNDHETERRTGRNPGIAAARDAAEAIGCGVVWPDGIRGTDWADYRLERWDQELARAGMWETAHRVRREVDAEMESLIMRHARLIR